MYSILKAFLVLMKLLSLSQFYAPNLLYYLNKMRASVPNFIIK